jgi:predicted RecB family nuclease
MLGSSSYAERSTVDRLSIEPEPEAFNRGGKNAPAKPRRMVLAATMQILDGRFVYSATDLNNYLACEHLTSLDMEVVRGARKRPEKTSGQAPLLSKLGEDHEQNYLAKLIADGFKVTVVERGHGDRRAALVQAAADTATAMARGDEFIYQATFFDGDWVGHSDFLRKLPHRLPGGQWDWHYEVEDTKLARHTEPYFLLQLAYYSEHVAGVQGALPAYMHVVLGNGERVSFRVEDVSAYYRSVRARFAERIAETGWQPYPAPIPHCGLCVWGETCEQRWVSDDHLSLVANITRLQVARLNDATVTTLHGLAAAGEDLRPPKMVAATFERLQRQARLQDEQRIALARGDEYPYRYELLESGIPHPDATDPDPRPEPKRGFFRLPEPSPGDVFFDMEGDPYFDIGTGLEYMFGIYTVADGFKAYWGCDRTAVPALDRLAEKRAFEAFIDDMLERRRRDPGMHVYHYAPYEKTALQKLALRHATREDEVDTILKDEVLVDLYAVVRQAVAVGQPSYSIKKIEEFYGKRSGDSGIVAGDDSILRFEEWLALRHDPARRNDQILIDLERYNKYDCVSTHQLRDWLLTLRTEAMKHFAIEIPPYAGKETETPKAEVKFVELKAALDTHIPEDFDPENMDRRPDVVPYFLARHMLEYHWREHKPIYWRFHDRCESHNEDQQALADDSESIIALVPHGEPEKVKRSQAHTFRFPPQFHKIESGECFDLDTKDKAGTIVTVEDGDDYGQLVLHRGPSLAELPLPKAITLRKIVQASSILEALARFGQALVDEGARTRYRAAYDVLVGGAPRLRGRALGSVIQPPNADEPAVLALCEALDESYLFVQGPPGSGKTYLGARLIVDLLARGKRVGVTANSHKAIHNLLDEVEEVARERGVDFIGLKKSTKDDDDTAYVSAHFTSSDKSLADPNANLVAGTAWAFGVEAMDQRLDYLFVDEAGQVSLPHAIAVMTAAKNTILLGDPLQLAQVSNTAHPGDLGVSVLQHVLEDLRPVAPDRGVLLTDSYRMHPDVCEFISELLYEGRLRSAADRERQLVSSAGLSGTGLRYLPTEHAGNSQRSDEEAERIVHEIGLLLDGTVRDYHGVTRPIGQADVIVVTPYNAQVRRLRRALDAAGFGGVEAGTVDKFQGREAFVVFFSTAASSAEDAPRGIGFIFDRQRFNVAISRARALAVMVGSPALLTHRATSVEEVQVVNGVCRFLEKSLRL